MIRQTRRQLDIAVWKFRLLRKSRLKQLQALKLEQENLRLHLNRVHSMFDLFDLLNMQKTNTLKPQQHSQIS